MTLKRVPPYFDTSHIHFNQLDYQQAIDTPPPLIPDTELLGELPDEERRGIIRQRDIDLFFRWLRLAKPGSSTLYHVGELDRDRVTDKTANLLGHVVLRSSELELVTLSQRRTGLFIREYSTQRTRQPVNQGHFVTLQALVASPPPPLIPPPQKPKRAHRRTKRVTN